jgi:hypothetical protein
MNVQGTGQVCFVPGVAWPEDYEPLHDEEYWFQGLLSGHGYSFGLMGVPDKRWHGPESEPHPRLHPCCFSPDNPPIFYKVKVINFRTKEQCEVEVVRIASTGDRVKLGTVEDLDSCVHDEEHQDEAGIDFKCETLIVGKDCRDWMERFFPKLNPDDDAFCCVGAMTLRLPAPSESPDE